ncbi:hypothetical protein D3C78_1446130 [compost metagenome]
MRVYFSTSETCLDISLLSLYLSKVSKLFFNVSRLELLQIYTEVLRVTCVGPIFQSADCSVHCFCEKNKTTIAPLKPSQELFHAKIQIFICGPASRRVAQPTLQLWAAGGGQVRHSSVCLISSMADNKSLYRRSPGSRRQG